MTMTSTVLQRPVQAKSERHHHQTGASSKPTKAANSTRSSRSTMAWSNEKLRFSCIDNIGLKQLWKLIALDTTSASSKQRSAMVLELEQQQQQQQPSIGGNNNNNNEVSNRQKESVVRGKQKPTKTNESDVNEDWWGNEFISA